MPSVDWPDRRSSKRRWNLSILITGPGWGRYYVGPVQFVVCYGVAVFCTLLGGQNLKVLSLQELLFPTGNITLQFSSAGYIRHHPLRRRQRTNHEALPVHRNIWSPHAPARAVPLFPLSTPCQPALHRPLPLL